MKIYVTGASGFVGSHVARALAEAGADVRTERVDLLAVEALRGAFDGCDAVVHVAALYSYEARPERIWAANLEGTRNVVEACLSCGVGRLVHTSTAGTCGPVAGRPATEGDEPPGYELQIPYKASKVAAERLVLGAVRDGLDAVVVNPTTPVGDGDTKPTPTGRMVRGVATGRIRAFVGTTGLNVVDVRDVARGHVLALERGRTGERYLLGGEDLSLQELFGWIAGAAGRPAPWLRIPYGVARAAAASGLANRQEVLLARLPMFFSHEKAGRELGYEPAPLDPAIKRAVVDAQAARSRQVPKTARVLDAAQLLRERRFHRGARAANPEHG